MGFFEIPQTINPRGLSCYTCGCYKYVKSPKIEPYGDFRLGIMNIGEAPGKREDEEGKPWQGMMGQALEKAYRKLGFSLFGDCININSLACRPINEKGENREPTSHEIACCRYVKVLDAIEEYKPKVIILLGNPAIESIIGYRWKSDLGKVTRWRGWIIPDRDFKCWISSTFHPSFTERRERDSDPDMGLEVRTIWMQDLERALNMHNVPFPEFEDETKQVEIVQDLSFLDNLQSPVAFDYETTGLKPHDITRHHIVCASVCDRPDHVYTFAMPEKGTTDWIKWRNFLRSERWAKIAQHMKFEQSWSVNMFRTEVKNWLWDPMIATHILDNRQDICSLEFQTYVNFGLIDFKSETKAYLEAGDKKNANSVNDIDKLFKSDTGRRKLLMRNGLDSLFEYRLALKQMKEMGYKW